MSDPVNESQSSSTSPETAAPKSTGSCGGHRRSRRRAGKAIVALLVLGGVFAAGSAFAGRSRNPSPEAMRDRAEWAIERFVDKVDGTDAQQTAFSALVDQHWAAAVGFHKEGRELKAQLAAALLADKVDARKVEVLRKQLVALVDRASATAASALVTGSGILTVEQKQDLFERFSDRFGG